MTTETRPSQTGRAHLETPTSHTDFSVINPVIAQAVVDNYVGTFNEKILSDDGARKVRDMFPGVSMIAEAEAQIAGPGTVALNQGKEIHVTRSLTNQLSMAGSLLAVQMLASQAGVNGTALPEITHAEAEAFISERHYKIEDGSTEEVASDGTKELQELSDKNQFAISIDAVSQWLINALQNQKADDPNIDKESLSETHFKNGAMAVYKALAEYNSWTARNADQIKAIELIKYNALKNKFTDSNKLSRENDELNTETNGDKNAA